MAKLTRRQKEIAEKVDPEKSYAIDEAVTVLSDLAKAKLPTTAEEPRVMQVKFSRFDPMLVMLLGGDPLGERHMYWNFVSNSAERIEQAKEDWRAGSFPPVPGDDEFIPLPEDQERAEKKAGEE